MKFFLLITALVLGQNIFAGEPPPNYPAVKGIVRKIDMNSGRVSIKHEAIPNLNMPGMTMSFLAQDSHMLDGLAVGDKINFAADEIDGELVVVWMEKAPPADVKTSSIFCTGFAPASPLTKIELEIRPDKYSTIRYEFAEGPYKGTAHINSIGHLHLHNRKDLYVYHLGSGKISTALVFRLENNKVVDACFTNFSSGMKRSMVQCSFE